VITADLPGDFQRIGLFSIGPINAPLFYSILAFLIFLFIQSRTVFAKQTYAIGSNLVTATLSGINVNRVVTCFSCCRATGGLHGVFQTPASGSPTDFSTRPDVIIAACGAGWTSTAGGMIFAR
jgi:rhamnose transport system permease protein